MSAVKEQHATDCGIMVRRAVANLNVEKRKNKEWLEEREKAKRQKMKVEENDGFLDDGFVS